MALYNLFFLHYQLLLLLFPGWENKKLSDAGKVFLKSMGYKIKKCFISIIVFNGASEGNRTPVSTLARSRSTIELHLQDGGPDEDRTRDLLRDREAC